MWRSLNPAATRLHKNLHRLIDSVNWLSAMMAFCLNFEVFLDNYSFFSLSKPMCQ